jgi:hypothetical protein
MVPSTRVKDLHLVDDTELPRLFVIPRQVGPMGYLVVDQSLLEARERHPATYSVHPQSYKDCLGSQPIQYRIHGHISSSVVANTHKRIEIDSVLSGKWIVCMNETAFRALEVRRCKGIWNTAETKGWIRQERCSRHYDCIEC